MDNFKNGVKILMLYTTLFSTSLCTLILKESVLEESDYNTVSSVRLAVTSRKYLLD